MDDFTRYIEDGLQGLQSRYPEARNKLELACLRLAEASSPEDYQSIGILCRDAMITFANAIFSPEFTPQDEKVPNWDDTSKRVELTLQHFGQMTGTREVRDLAKKVVAYAMRLHHNQHGSHQEARRTLLYTTLALIELADLVETGTRNNEWVQNFGAYKCQACGSTKLETFENVELNDEGFPASAWEFLMCMQCRSQVGNRSLP